MKLDRKRVLGWVREAAFLLAIFVAVHLVTTRKAAKGVAPELSGVGLDGRTLSLQALRGQPAVVHFWATWCPICRQEEGTIEALAKDHPVLTVATQSGSPAEIAAYLAKQGVHMPALADPESRLAALYGVNSFPSTFILDRSGRIRFVEVGYTTSLGLRLRLWLAGL